MLRRLFGKKAPPRAGGRTADQWYGGYRYAFQNRALIMLIRAGDFRWSYAAADVLVQIGAAAVSALREMLIRGPEYTRLYAADALKKIGVTPELTSVVEKMLAQHQDDATLAD